MQGIPRAIPAADGTSQVLKDLRIVLVPTTSEILWGVISGDILEHGVAEADQQHRLPDEHRLPADREDHGHPLQADL